jgi:hypothetical protein
MPNYLDEWGVKAPSIYGGASGSAAPAPPVGTASAPIPTAPPPAPAGSVQTSPGYNPDWGGLITSDPAYLSAKAGADLAQGNAAAQRKQMLQQALIRYGGLPPGFSDKYGDIGQSTQDQAGANQYSVLANLARNYSQNTEQFKRGLAARGALQSGDLNYGADQLENAYGQQRYDAANAVGGQVNDALSQYMGVLSGNAQNLSGALQGAEANVYANPAYRPSAPQSANYDAGNSSAYGQPIYVDSSGNLFDQNGNPFTPSGSAAPPGAGGDTGGGDVYFRPPDQTQTYAPVHGTWAV